MNDVRASLNNDLRDSWRALKGIKNYLDVQGTRLDNNADRVLKHIEKAKKAEQKQQKLINDAASKLETSKQRIDMLKTELKGKVESLLQIPKSWIKDAETKLQADPGSVINTVKGIDNFLEQKKNELDSIRRETIHEEKIQRIIDSLDSIKTDCSEIMNPGIEQRIELFSQSVKTNPDNSDTLNKIDDFKQQINKMMDDHEEKKEDREYVGQVFSDALGGDVKSDDGGNSIIEGEIDGVPITVRLNDKDNEINMETPTDGSCRKGLEALQKKLIDKNIRLGEIKVLDTGETLNQDQKIRTTNRSLDA